MFGSGRKVRRLGLGFTNPVGRVFGLRQCGWYREGGYCCDSGLFVYMAGPGIAYLYIRPGSLAAGVV